MHISSLDGIGGLAAFLMLAEHTGVLRSPTCAARSPPCYSGRQLSRVEEPGGKVSNIRYNQFGDVISVLDDKGVGHSFEFDYDKGTRQYYANTRFSSGKIKEVWYNTTAIWSRAMSTAPKPARSGAAAGPSG